MRKFIPLIFGHVLVLLHAWARHFLDCPGAQQRFLILADAFFIPAVLLGSIGLLELMSRGGQFHGLNYAFYLLRARFVVYKNTKKPQSYAEFLKGKGGKERRSAWPFLAAAIYFFCLAALFCYLFSRTA